MTILFWLICFLLAIGITSLIIAVFIRHPSFRQSIATLFNGFKEGLKGSGVISSSARYPVELWKWQTMDDEEVCEDCWERSQWPPMDIADWMKEGLPRTKEADTHCCDNCRCQLVPFKKSIFKNKHQG